MRRLILMIGLGLGCHGGTAAAEERLKAQVEHFVEQHEQAIVSELVDLLSIPNVSADVENIRKNAEFLWQMLDRRGFESEILPTDGNPLVYGELRVPGAERTLLLYAHYDGQPVDPAGWQQPDPFIPILRDGRLQDHAREIPAFRQLSRFDSDWRLYARSASDDKAPIVALCAALDFLKASAQAPTSNLRVLLDGEEEAGSPSLVPAIERYRNKLEADLMIILDGPLHPSGSPTAVFGARGILSLEMTVYGPKSALHSGHYGNWVPNPVLRLARLLASMKDDQGQVQIDGFYDGIDPLTPEEEQLLDEVPDQAEELQRLFGFSQPERAGQSLQQALQLPSFNIRGIAGAYVGAQARTIIPDQATASVDVRLVKESPVDAMREKILAHIRKQGYHVVDSEPDDATRSRYPKIVQVDWRSGTNAYRTSPLAPEARLVTEALTRTFGSPPVRIRTMGGTLPIAPFIEVMGFPALSVPTVNFDNNQHSENENLRLGSFFQSVVTMAALLRM